MSVPTCFINAGGRYNRAQKDVKGSYERYGVLTGCVGARLEKPNVMEWKHLVISRQQNTVENGYGPVNDSNDNSRLLGLWAKFYGLDYFPTFDEVVAAERDTSQIEAFDAVYVKISAGYFNCNVYGKRMRLSVEPFLRDADQRAQEKGKKAHCVVVGLGLGVWRLANEQTQLLVDTYRLVCSIYVFDFVLIGILVMCMDDVRNVLKEVPLPNIAEITFSWFDPARQCGNAQSGYCCYWGYYHC